MLKHFWQAIAEEMNFILALTKRLKTVDGAVFVQCFLVIGAIVVWIVLGHQLPEAIFASPLETAEAFFLMLGDYRRDYAVATINSLGIFIGGFCIAVMIGTALSLAMSAWPVLGRALTPMLDLLASVPNIAFMPLIVAFLGLGLEPKMMIVFLAAVVPITINSHAAIRQVDPSLTEAAMTLGATRLTALRKIIWPSALPAINAGFRIGATQALTACVIAELYTAMTGLGGLLSGYSNGFNMPRYFVTVITLALIGIFSTFLLRLIERRITKHLIGITL